MNIDIRIDLAAKQANEIRQNTLNLLNAAIVLKQIIAAQHTNTIKNESKSKKHLDNHADS